MVCQGKGQYLTFSGVNAHHIRGISERIIMIFQEIVRTMLIYNNKKVNKISHPQFMTLRSPTGE